MNTTSRRFPVLRPVSPKGPLRRYSFHYREKDVLGHAITPAPIIVVSEGDIELELDSHDIRLLVSMFRDKTYNYRKEEEENEREPETNL